jgi:hypothetical protein
MIIFSHIGTFLTVGNDIINIFWLYKIRSHHCYQSNVHTIATNPTFPCFEIPAPPSTAATSFILAGGGAVNSVRLLPRNELLEPDAVSYYHHIPTNLRIRSRSVSSYMANCIYIYIYIYIYAFSSKQNAIRVGGAYRWDK